MANTEKRTKECIICKQSFEYVPSKKTCSKECQKKHRKNRSWARYFSKTVTYNCRFCNKSVTKNRKGEGLCNRSCASKYYVANGTYKKWHEAGVALAKEQDQGIVTISCIICNSTFERRVYRQNKDPQITCSKKCGYEYVSKTYSGENSHLYGTKIPQEQIDRQTNTMKERYGVTNGFFLAKNRKTVSKGQLELFKLLSESLDNVDVQKEKRVNVEPKEYYADILLPTHGIIVEYHGDFWHANPKKYSEDYFNPKKQLYAREIWELDKIRLDKLQEKYKVYIIWESDFYRNKQKVLKELVENIKNDIR